MQTENTILTAHQVTDDERAGLLQRLRDAGAKVLTDPSAVGQPLRYFLARTLELLGGNV